MYCVLRTADEGLGVHEDAGAEVQLRQRLQGVQHVQSTKARRISTHRMKVYMRRIKAYGMRCMAHTAWYAAYSAQCEACKRCRRRARHAAGPGPEADPQRQGRAGQG